MQNVQTQQFRLFSVRAEITPFRYTIKPNSADHKGNVIICAKGTEPARAHPSRLLPINPDGASVYRGETSLLANCPHCEREIEVGITNAKHVICPDHGQFDLDWADIEAGRIPAKEVNINGKAPKKLKKKPAKPRVPRSLKIPMNIDFAAIKKAGGEIWTRGGEFDYVAYTLRCHVVVVAGKSPRKFCFNSYNMTWGKKSRANELAAFLENKQHDGKVVGNQIKNTIEQVRKKLEKEGYIKE